MRPRLGARGELAGPKFRVTDPFGLQCGHGWAPVESQAFTGIIGQIVFKLQCGHGWASVENCSCDNLLIGNGLQLVLRAGGHALRLDGPPTGKRSS